MDALTRQRPVQNAGPSPPDRAEAEQRCERERDDDNEPEDVRRGEDRHRAILRGRAARGINGSLDAEAVNAIIMASSFKQTRADWPRRSRCRRCECLVGYPSL